MPSTTQYHYQEEPRSTWVVRYEEPHANDPAVIDVYDPMYATLLAGIPNASVRVTIQKTQLRLTFRKDGKPWHVAGHLHLVWVT